MRALLGVALVFVDIGDFDTVGEVAHLTLEFGGERRALGSAGKDDVFPPVRSAFGSACGFGVGHVFDEQLGSRALGGQAGGADG